MQSFGLLVTGLFVTVALAACIGDGQKNDVPPAQATAAAYDENTGSVTGQVIDESLLPIEGAVASLLPPNATAVYRFVRTDPSGRFAFNFIPAGDYKVEIKAPGFEVLVRDVKLMAGDIQDLKFRMTVGFADVAYYVTDHLTRMIGGGTVKYGFECSITPWQPITGSTQASLIGKYCVGGNTCLAPECQSALGGGQTPTSSGCQGSYSKDTTTKNEYGGTGYPGGYRDLLMNESDWKAQISEVTWQPSSAVSGRGVLYEVLGPNVTNGDGSHTSRCGGINQSDPRDFLAISDQPPLRIEINHDLMEARNIAPQDHCCDWRFRLFPGWCDLGNCARWGPDANVLGVVAPTKVDVYYTIFFKEAPPPGWSTLDDR